MSGIYVHCSRCGAAIAGVAFAVGSSANLCAMCWDSRCEIARLTAENAALTEQLAHKTEAAKMLDTALHIREEQLDQERVTVEALRATLRSMGADQVITIAEEGKR